VLCFVQHPFDVTRAAEVTRTGRRTAIDPRAEHDHGIETRHTHACENWTLEIGVRWTEVVQSTRLYGSRRAQ